MNTIQIKRNAFVGLVSLLLVALLTGCSLNTTDLDEKTNRFSTIDRLPDSSIKAQQIMPLGSLKDQLVVRSAATDNVTALTLQKFDEFVYESFVKMDKFEKVISTDDLERELISEGGVEGVSDLRSLISLSNLAKNRGDFLIADYQLIWEGSYTYSFDIKMTRASDAEVLFHARHTVINWIGLDGPLFYPVFNSVMDWVEACEAVNAAPAVANE